MNPTVVEIAMAAFMAAVGISLVAWFLRDLAAVSGGRMTRMLARVGVDPQVAGRGETGAIMREARRRCRGCRSEALCERWLDGKAEGGNDFCPNAGVFRRLI